MLEDYQQSLATQCTVSESKRRGTEGNGGSSDESGCSGEFHTSVASHSHGSGSLISTISLNFLFGRESGDGGVDSGGNLLGLVPHGSDGASLRSELFGFGGSKLGGSGTTSHQAETDASNGEGGGGS